VPSLAGVRGEPLRRLRPQRATGERNEAPHQYFGDFAGDTTTFGGAPTVAVFRVPSRYRDRYRRSGVDLDRVLTLALGGERTLTSLQPGDDDAG
jgi:hypothetical protein